MTQLANQVPISGVVTGVSMAQKINDAYKTVQTSFYGTVDPATIAGITVLPGMTWADSGTDIKKIRSADGLTWVPFMVLSTGDIVGYQTHAAAVKTVVADADEIGLMDSAAAWVKKKITWANIKTVLQTGLQFLAAGVGAVLRSIQDKLRDSVSIKDFGAVGDGITDDTLAINRALAVGGRIHAPAGTYLVSSALTVTQAGTYLYGTGDKTVFRTNSPTADIFTAGGNNIILADFSCASTVVKTAGFAINATGLNYSRILRINAQSQTEYLANGKRLWGGIKLNQFAYVTVSDCELIGCQNDAILGYGSLTTYSTDLVIDGHTLIFFAGQYGVHIAGGVGAVYYNDASIFGCGRGVMYDKSVINVRNQQVFLTAGCTIDSSNDSNLFIAADSAQLVEITGAWLSSAGFGPVPSGEMSGIHVDPVNANLELRISGSRIYNNKGYGIVLNGGILYLGGKSIISSNGISLALTGHGINIAAAAVLYADISENEIINNSGFGISFSGSVNGVRVANNYLTGNGAGPISLFGGETLTQQVFGNRGYISSNMGTASIPANGTFVVVNHGLSAAPQFVLLTLANGATLILYADTYTSTQFTIRVSGPTFAAVALVTWRAFTGPVA